MPNFPGGKLNHVNPILNVANLQSSLDFYTEVLGLELYHLFGKPPDFAIVGRDGLQIYLCENGQGQSETWLAMFVQDLPKMYEAVKSKGARIIKPLADDEFRVADPDGHVFRFMQ